MLLNKFKNILLIQTPVSTAALRKQFCVLLRFSNRNYNASRMKMNSLFEIQNNFPLIPFYLLFCASVQPGGELQDPVLGYIWSLRGQVCCHQQRTQIYREHWLRAVRGIQCYHGDSTP